MKHSISPSFRHQRKTARAKHRIRISVAVDEVREAVDLILMRAVHLDHLRVRYVKDCQDVLS